MKIKNSVVLLTLFLLLSFFVLAGCAKKPAGSETQPTVQSNEAATSSATVKSDVTTKPDETESLDPDDGSWSPEVS